MSQPEANRFMRWISDSVIPWIVFLSAIAVLYVGIKFVVDKQSPTPTPTTGNQVVSTVDYDYPSYNFNPPANPGNGYTVRCKDGTLSHAGGRQGACSHHGGVG